MEHGAVRDRIEAVRRFNRFYTTAIGVLPEGHLNSPFSLAAARILYELAHRTRPTATEIGAALRLDAGYMSRILRRFVQDGFVTGIRAKRDGRQTLLTLTKKGRTTFAALDSRARADVTAILGHLPAVDQDRVVDAMQTVERLLTTTAPPLKSEVQVRPPRPGDLGWVVERHGAIYTEEYGWNRDFEALVARIVADFAERFDPARERCWIAERDGGRAGCVFLVKKSKSVAKLRLLLVEPSARGAGIGKRLVDECTRFAREAGYRKIVLWTNSILKEARGIYERAGYRLIATEPQHIFGHALVFETWELTL